MRFIPTDRPEMSVRRGPTGYIKKKKKPLEKKKKL